MSISSDNEIRKDKEIAEMRHRYASRTGFDRYAYFNHDVYMNNEFQKFNIDDGKLLSWIEGYGLSDFFAVEYDKHSEIVAAFN